MSAVPFAVLVYLVQRMAHVQCAVIVELWAERPEDYLIPKSEKGTLEKVNDRIESVFS